MHLRFLCIFIISIQYSCIEKLEWEEAESPSERLVVEGSITSEQKSHLIKLSRTQPVIVDKPPAPVTGAMVSISDGTQLFMLTEIEPGIYSTEATVQGIVGYTYQLRIEAEGEYYEAYATMIKAEPINAVSISPWDIKINFGEGVEYFQFLYRDNFGSKVPYKYEVTTEINPDVRDYYPSDWVVPRWIQTQLDKIEKENDPVTSDSIYYLHPGLEPPAIFAYGESNEPRLAYGSKVTEKFYSMTNEHYTFVRAMLSETEWKGLGPFGYVAANVSGNISNNALGYFYASDVFIIEQVVLE